MSNSETYQVRWRGKVTGPFPLASLQAMLSRNEISLMHEVLVDGRWLSLEELLLFTKQNQKSYQPEPEQDLPAPPPPTTMAPKASQPPPIPPEETFHVAKGGRQEGPYTKSALRQLAAAGVVSSEDLAWKEGMPEWMPLGRLMADLPRPAPPPPFTQSPGHPVPPTRQTPEQPTKTPDAGAHGVVAGGYVCSLLALLFFPPFLALAGFICGIVALAKGKVGHGIAILLLSLVCGFLGMAIGAASFAD